jgi:xylan 1,4-beta-xylosidase
VKMKLTYCNPLSLPDYQRGLSSFDKEKNNDDGKWLHDIRRDFREMADPTVIQYKGRWYLFPSCGILWSSDDMVNWNYQPVEPHDPGYAPTVVEKGDYLYLTACGEKMWRARDTMGPWEMIGNIKDEYGNEISLFDPMLFVDDDGAMYCYFSDGRMIYAAKMKDSDPTSFDGPRVVCFGFNPDNVWERYGESNQDIGRSWIEGPWMTKRNGRYYLQYSAPGTEWKCYALGCYTGDSPVGPFLPQAKNPILIEKGGLINGCGHHSMVEGPDGKHWCFYTTLVKIEYKFERRIGMDPVGFDENGEMYVAGPTETPQFAPGIMHDPAIGNDAGLLPLSVNEIVRASSYAPGHEPVYAVDNYIRTWWEAADSTVPQWIRVDLDGNYEVFAARTLFADRGLDYDAGVLPAPYKYRIDGSLDGNDWFVLVDKSGNDVEKHIVYDTWDSQKARYVKLVVLEAPSGMPVSVWEFTVFGKS